MISISLVTCHTTKMREIPSSHFSGRGYTPKQIWFKHMEQKRSALEVLVGQSKTSSKNDHGKALNREVEPYGFFLVKAIRKYHHVLGRGLFPIASALFRWKCNQTKCDIRKCQNIFFLLLRPLLMIWIHFWRAYEAKIYLICILNHFYFKGEKA